jgi:acetate kinase
MSDGILVFNAGSSSLKFSGYERTAKGPALLFAGEIQQAKGRMTVRDGLGQSVLDEQAPGDETKAVSRVLEWSRGAMKGVSLQAVGHRVVHGGAAYCVPVKADDGVIKALEGLVPLAPLHQGYNITPIRVVMRQRPGVMQVACFDTGFHATQGEMARAVALPEEGHRPVWVSRVVV